MIAFNEVISSWYFDFMALNSSSFDVSVINTAVFRLSRSPETFTSSEINRAFSSFAIFNLSTSFFKSAEIPVKKQNKD